MNVGCRMVQVPDARGGTPFPMLVMYPTRAAEQPERVGPYPVTVAIDAPVEPGPHPLVIVSHGTGGSHLLYRIVGAHLARSGFVVAAPEHPRNNRNDNSLGGTDTIVANRPEHVRQAIDWVYADAPLGPVLAPDTVAVVGHSLGGYTGLALAGGHPYCGPHESADGEAHPVPVTADARVKALVLLAPATPWFAWPGGLVDVHVPILMVTGEKDESTTAWHAETVLRGLPETTSIEHVSVPGAGHYSFLAPFPEAMTNPSFPPSQDPPGFDRAAFHEELKVLVEGFLRRTL
jgi:predicted dienelactone hydrolase